MAAPMPACDLRRRLSCSEILDLDENMDAHLEYYEKIWKTLETVSSDEGLKRMTCRHKSLPAREKFDRFIKILEEIKRHTASHVKDDDGAEPRNPPGRDRDSGIASANSEVLKPPVQESGEADTKQNDPASMKSCTCSKSSECSTLKSAVTALLPTEEQDNLVNDLQERHQTSPKKLLSADPSPRPPECPNDPVLNMATGSSATPKKGLDLAGIERALDQAHFFLSFDENDEDSDDETTLQNDETDSSATRNHSTYPR